ncbi:MAG: YbaK/EbsC family protein [Candidatus Doudnabacteria bacterium]|nr:YbaK/EbsC family protein [Candidatus Doudnabacteria bacterium]
MPKKKISKKAKIKKQTKIIQTKVTKLLDQAKIKYKTLEHKVVFTAHDVGATTKRKLSEIAKVVLVKVDGWEPSSVKSSIKKKDSVNFVLIVLPAGKYVDFSGIKKALKAKKVSMASEKDIAKYLKTKVGLLHPFGSEYNLQTLLDKGMSRSKKMIASAGTFTDSVEVGLKDFQKMVKPILGNFSKAKK